MNYSKQTIGIMCILSCSLILNSCKNNENGQIIQKEIISNRDRQKQKDSCLTQINSELIRILSNRVDLKTYLLLNDSDIDIILGKPTNRNRKEQLIEKLSTSISDTSILPIKCNSYDKLTARTGALALISLYKIEKFPFAAALGLQWCTGDSMSDDIHLPYDLINYIGYRGDYNIQEHYKSYLKSDIRRE